MTTKSPSRRYKHDIKRDNLPLPLMVTRLSKTDVHEIIEKQSEVDPSTTKKSKHETRRRPMGNGKSNGDSFTDDALQDEHRGLSQKPINSNKKINARTTATATMRLFSSICLVYLSGLGMLSFRETNHHHHHPENDYQRHVLEGFKTPKTPVSEVYVISMTEAKFDTFRHRNFDLSSDGVEVPGENTDDDHGEPESAPTVSVEWFKSINGMNQTILDQYAEISNLKPINLTDFEGLDARQRKEKYDSPHAVGCYLSHLRTLEIAWRSWGNRKQSVNPSPWDIKHDNTIEETHVQQRRKKPDMLFVFEDDSHCVSNVVDRTWSVVQQLPKDWDILYIGGKPMSYYTKGMPLADFLKTQKTQEKKSRPKNDELLKEMCKGSFGNSTTGPMPPENFPSGSQPPYWRIKNILNTNSYVINPKRIRRVLRVLSKPMQYYKPVDVVLADDMWREFFDPAQYNRDSNSTSAPLKAFLTPEMYCDQEVKRFIVDRDHPPAWEGYHWFPWREFRGFPDMKGYVWGKTASFDMCSKLETAKS